MFYYPGNIGNLSFSIFYYPGQILYGKLIFHITSYPENDTNLVCGREGGRGGAGTGGGAGARRRSHYGGSGEACLAEGATQADTLTCNFRKPGPKLEGTWLSIGLLEKI